MRLVGIERRDHAAFVWSEQVLQDRAALCVEVGGDLRPVERVDARGDIGGCARGICELGEGHTGILKLKPSFRGARSASPESITLWSHSAKSAVTRSIRQSLWIPGLRQAAHPGNDEAKRESHAPPPDFRQNNQPGTDNSIRHTHDECCVQHRVLRRLYSNRPVQTAIRLVTLGGTRSNGECQVKHECPFHSRREFENAAVRTACGGQHQADRHLALALRRVAKSRSHRSC